MARKQPNPKRSVERLVMWYRKSADELWDFWGYARDEAELEWTRELFNSNPKYKDWQLHVVPTTFPV